MPPAPGTITVYDEDGNPWDLSPVDAREAIAGGHYSAEPPAGKLPEAQSRTNNEGEPARSLRGHLPEGFPGKAALEAEGYGTYAKVRKLRDAGTLTSVTGIGDATAAEIEAALED